MPIDIFSHTIPPSLAVSRSPATARQARFVPFDVTFGASTLHSIDVIASRLSSRRRRSPSRIAAFIAALLLASAVVGAQLGPRDLERLPAYGTFWEDTNTNISTLPTIRQREIADATSRARAEFAGRGVEIAQHFLTHTDHQVRNEAYWFVLGALADVQAATVLIRALPEPPPAVAGVLARDQAEVGIAIETMLTSPAIAENQTVTNELVKAIEVRTPRSGPPHHAVELLGKCRTPFARAVLQRLLADPSPQIRALAAQALGPGSMVTTGQEVSLEALIRVLEQDPDLEARVAAAGALGRLKNEQGIAALSRASDRERAPRVVDAILTALQQAEAPITDPHRCRAAIERAWEPQPARFCFERWRASVDREALVEAATNAPPVLRILAIEALIEPPVQRQIVSRSVSGPPPMDPQLRSRLLTSLRELLSTPRSELGPIMPHLAQEALWEVSGYDVPTALEYADAISPLSARFAASERLASHDAAAYARIRRPDQIGVALAVAVAGLALALLPAARPTAFCVTLSAVIWALWIARAMSVRDLPPPPIWLMFFTVPAVSLLTGAGIVSVSTWLRQQWMVSGLKAFAFVAATVLGAGFVALIIAGWARSVPLFPSSNSGWDTMFEPIAAGLLAMVWAAFLVATISIARRVARP
jgi:HEAT repeat protein